MEADVDGKSYEWLRGRKDIKTSRSAIQPRDICQKAELMANEENKELPILAYLGAGRVWSQKRESRKYFPQAVFPHCWLYGCIA